MHQSPPPRQLTISELRAQAAFYHCVVVTEELLNDMGRTSNRVSKELSDLRQALSVAPNWRKRIYWKLWARV